MIAAIVTIIIVATINAIAMITTNATNAAIVLATSTHDSMATEAIVINHPEKSDDHHCNEKMKHHVMHNDAGS